LLRLLKEMIDFNVPIDIVDYFIADQLSMINDEEVRPPPI
jgi:hypothetical protein